MPADTAASTPNLSASAASGTEDTAIALSITSTLADTDGSESQSIVISGVPSGAVLSAGTNNGDGTWTLTSGQLAGLTITPPSNSDTDFTLTVVSTATEANGGDTASSTATLAVTVAADADAPSLSASAASGTEDTAIALSITSTLADTDGSESQSIVISGVPTGAVLSAGTNNGDGTWTLTSGQLAGLTITPPSNSDADFTLTVVSTATEANGGDTASSTATLVVTVAADADAPSLSASAASGNEDTAIALSITSALADTDGSESLSLVVSGVPTGATLSAGSANPDGTWTLTLAQLSGLTITPPSNSDADFNLTIVATATEATGGDTASSTTTLAVTVASVNDAPVDLTLTGGSIAENSAIGSTVGTVAGVDVDSGEVLTYSLVNSAGGKFAVNASTGVITSAGSLDYEAASSHTIVVRVTDAAGATYDETMTVSVTDVTGETLVGGAGSDTLLGGTGSDTLSGGSGADYLSGGDGDDVLLTSNDNSWSGGFVAFNAGGPGHAGSGETAAINGSIMSNDVFIGGNGTDTLQGSTGNDILFLDDSYSALPSGYAGARLSGIEIIDVGDGNDVVDLTSSTYGYGDVSIIGGNGNDVLWSSSGNDSLSGGSGNDTLSGGYGNDVLDGG
ncbi:MAG: calcium-binding protein, partial [Alphaproteobacteria bacterium]|nr:calcium-binding protein [Alphaproteobacteria bacterium]